MLDNQQENLNRRFIYRTSSSSLNSLNTEQEKEDNKMLIRGGRKRKSKSNQTILLASILLATILLINYFINQQADCKKIKSKDKKLLKSLVQGLIVKKLSTKKNFLPIPVPIPVPIELSEPPVYLKGQPKYVTIYKPAPPQPPPPTAQPVVKPTTVYHMPVYSPTYEYMNMDPSYGLYSSMMMDGNQGGYSGGASIGNAYGANMNKQHQSGRSNNPLGSTINFTDYDDEYGNYYLRGRQMSGYGSSYSKNAANNYSNNGKPLKRKNDNVVNLKRGDNSDSKLGLATLSVEEEESFVTEDRQHKRVKRQLYHESSYENEPPCYGFPLEINIKSRIKMDQLFPIQGKSQYKKCIKVGRPLLPPVQDDAPY